METTIIKYTTDTKFFKLKLVEVETYSIGDILTGSYLSLEYSFNFGITYKCISVKKICEYYNIDVIDTNIIKNETVDNLNNIIQSMKLYKYNYLKRYLRMVSKQQCFSIVNFNGKI